MPLLLVKATDLSLSQPLRQTKFLTLILAPHLDPEVLGHKRKAAILSQQDSFCLSETV